MQGMISRYRDRLSNSTSEIKALSASREKSISGNNSNIPTQSPLIMNTMPSNESLNKHNNKQPLQHSTAGKLSLANQNVADSNLLIAGSLKQLPQHKHNLTNTTISNNNSSLPPSQPTSHLHTKQKLKQSTVSISTTNNNDHAFKSSNKKTTTKQSIAVLAQASTSSKNKQKQIVGKQRQGHREKQGQREHNHKERSKSKSKKHSRLSNKKSQMVQLTPQQLTQSFSESIYDVLVSQIRQKNMLVNYKQEMKLKIAILLQQYWQKRYQVSQGGKQLHQEYDYPYQQVKCNNNQQQQLMAQSTITHGNPISHLQYNQPLLSSSSTFTTQLQKRFFQTQKQRQFLQKKLQSFTKKLQSMSKQLQRYAKMQRLVNNTIESENQARREVVRLRKELEYSQLKNSQQQKVWRKEMGEISEIIQQLKGQLRERYEVDGIGL